MYFQPKFHNENLAVLQVFLILLDYIWMCFVWIYFTNYDDLLCFQFLIHESWS